MELNRKTDLAVVKKQHPKAVRPIRVGTDLLYASMRHLTRQQLDDMPLMNRRFLAILQHHREALPQCRVAKSFHYNPGYLDNQRPKLQGEGLFEAYPRVFDSIHNKLKITTQKLAQLLEYEPNLRVSISTIQCRTSDFDKEWDLLESAAKQFASLWAEGGSLEIRVNSSRHIRLSPELIGGCSSLLCERYTFYRQMSRDLAWRGAPFGSVESGTPLIRRIVLQGKFFQKITWENIVDQLFHPLNLPAGGVEKQAGETAPKGRELVITALKPPPGKWADYSPLRLKQLIQKRLVSNQDSPPIFSLTLGIVARKDEGQVGQWDLLPPTENPCCPDVESRPHRQCCFTSRWLEKFGIGLFTKGFLINVQCK